MHDRDFRVPISGEDALHLLELAEIAANSKDLAELAQEVLPILARVMGAAATVLYFEEHIPPIHSFFQEKVQDIPFQPIEKICAEHFHQIPILVDCQPVILSLTPQETV